MGMLHAVLLVVAHDLLEYRYVDDVMGNWFFLFCSTVTAVIMFVRLFQAKASESLKKKGLAGAIIIVQKRKVEKRRRKELLSTWECLNDKQSLQQLPSCVISTRHLLFCKMFLPLFCFEQQKTSKNFLTTKWSSWPGIVRWLAFILNPELLCVFLIHTLCTEWSNIYLHLHVIKSDFQRYFCELTVWLTIRLFCLPLPVSSGNPTICICMYFCCLSINPLINEFCP